MEPKDYPHVFYNAKWGAYVSLIMSVMLISVVVYGGLNGNGSEMSVLWLVLVIAVFFWLGWKSINDKSPALKFGPDGIWTPKLGFMPWEKVHLEFERVSAYKSGSMEYLMISKRQTRKHLDNVSLSSLRGSYDEVKNLLQEHSLK